MNANKTNLEKILESMTKDEVNEQQKIIDHYSVLSNKENIEAKFIDNLLKILSNNRNTTIKIDIGAPKDSYTEIDEIYYGTIERFLYNLKKLLLIKEYKIFEETKYYLDIVPYDEFVVKITTDNSVKLKKYLKNTREEINKRIIFSISKNKKSNLIILNNKYVIAKVEFNGPNDKLFDYILSKKRSEFNSKEIEKITGDNRSIIKRINDLGFKGELKKMFFPTITKNKLVFINPINESQFKSQNINSEELERQIDKLEKLNNPL